jgi:hypothetical protein
VENKKKTNWFLREVLSFRKSVEILKEILCYYMQEAEEGTRSQRVGMRQGKKGAADPSAVKYQV